MGFWYKLLMEIVNLVANNRIGFTLMRKLGLFKALFVMYPANANYADYYTFRWRQRRIMWKPFIVGFLRHPSGALALSCAISAGHDEIRSPKYVEDLRLMNKLSKEILELLGGTSLHFAGILPSRLVHLKEVRSKTEDDGTAVNVTSAVKQLRISLEHPSDAPVFLLGYRGYVGRKVLKFLKEEGIEVVGVEKEDVFSPPDYPHIALNITIPEAINVHVESFNEHTVVLNEVYPAPHENVLEYIKEEKGASVYHIAGVKAKAVPPFPSAYEGAVPCCAAMTAERYEVVMKRLC